MAAALYKRNFYIIYYFHGPTYTVSVIIKNPRFKSSQDKMQITNSLSVIHHQSNYITFHLKDKVPSSAASFCVYSFTCSCGACYIGRTTRHLSVRAREYHPAWLRSGVTKSIKSSVLAHLVDTGHTIDIKQSFQPIYRVKGNQSKLIRHRILATAEVIGIRLFNPPLCAQKQFVQTLKLPRPSISPHPHHRLHK